MTETRSLVVALEADVDAKEQAKIAEELEDRDDVVNVQEIVIGGTPDE